MPNIVLYAGQFGDPAHYNNMTVAENIADSHFNTSILGFLHVHDVASGGEADPDVQVGDIWFNYEQPGSTSTKQWLAIDGQVVQSLVAPLKKAIQLLKGQDSRKVMFSIGGGDGISDHDYNAIQYLFDTNNDRFTTNLNAICKTFLIDGIDLDYEPINNPYSKFEPGILMLVSWLDQQGLEITAAPYTEFPWWASLLNKIYTTHNSQLFDWLNYQIYGGGPYSFFYEALQQAGEIGVNDLAQFILPGYTVGKINKPVQTTYQELQEYLSTLKTQYSTINGAFLYDYEQIAQHYPNTTKEEVLQYSDAILVGVQS